MEKYRKRYVWTNRFGHPEHSYELIGQRGGLHLHVSDYRGSKHMAAQFTAGLEVHERVGRGAPTHDECWLLKAPCWHAGTTSYAEEVLLPRVLRANFAPDLVLKMLEEEADERWPADA